jgi:hypothetical protein
MDYLLDELYVKHVFLQCSYYYSVRVSGIWIQGLASGSSKYTEHVQLCPILTSTLMAITVFSFSSK